LTPRLRSTSAILVAFAVPLAVYVASLHGNVAFWDTGDLQTVPYILGIPYPTGFPGFVLLGWLWSHLFAVGAVAWRMNLLTAVASAATAAAATAFLLSLGVSETIGVAAALVYAFASVPWTHATAVDVHPVSFAVTAWAAVFALRWSRDGALRDGALAGLDGALAVAIDNTSVLALAGVAVIAAARRPPAGPALRLAAASAAIILAAYAYLPLRSAAVTRARVDPTLALGIAPGRPFWDDGHPATPANFARVVTGSSFGTGKAVRGLLSPENTGRLGGEFVPALRRDVGDVVPWLAVFGGLLFAWRAPFAAAGLTAVGLIPLLFVFAYSSESDTARYFLPAYFAIACAAGYGASAIGRALPRGAALIAGFTGLLLLISVAATDRATNADQFGQPQDPGATDWIARVRAVTAPDAIVVAPWMYATPLGYAAFVDRAFGRRIVVTADAADYAPAYRRWMRTRPVVIVSDDPVHLNGFDTIEIDRGDPHLYALR
jgi:hypothetical protein